MSARALERDEVFSEEEIRELLFDAEREARYERQRRIESEALLDELSRLAGARTPQEVFSRLLAVVRSKVPWSAALLLVGDGDASLRARYATAEAFRETRWTPGALFRRVLGGQPAVLFDIGQVAEWQAQPARVRENVGSALHLAVTGLERPYMLVLTHPQRGRLGRKHLKGAKRFVPFVCQTIVQMEFRRLLDQRDRLFTLSHDLMCVVDLGGVIRQLSPRWAALLGDGGGARCLFDLVHPEDAQLMRDVWAQLVTGTEYLEFEARLRLKDDSFCRLAWSMTAPAAERVCYGVAREIGDRRPSRSTPRGSG
jgi:PAS domain-containing protein